MMKLLHRAPLWLLALVILAGCASSKITSRQAYTGEKIARPDHIIVHDFTANASGSPAQTPEQIETGRKLGAEVAKELILWFGEQPATLRKIARWASTRHEGVYCDLWFAILSRLEQLRNLRSTRELENRVVRGLKHFGTQEVDPRTTDLV